MSSDNEKLTAALGGRTINGTSQSNGAATVSFTDGSKLTIESAPSNSNSASSGGTIEAAHIGRDPAILHIDFRGGYKMEFPLASETASVTLTDEAGTVQTLN